MSETVNVTVTGAAGQVAYAMLGRIASGEVFGPGVRVSLRLLEITPALPTLGGVAMELDDCASTALKEVIVTDDASRAFDGVNWALLVGSFPRKEGMERKELLGINGKIFVGQGKDRKDCWPTKPEWRVRPPLPATRRTGLRCANRR